MLLGSAYATAAPSTPTGQSLRECVREAAAPGEITSCEREAGEALQQRITSLTEHIRKQLRGPDRAIFERNIAAWKAYVTAEKAMQELVFVQGHTGFGQQLRIGAFNELLEQRVAQLVDYLHTLKKMTAETRRSGGFQ